jgi:hypothetical protein
MFYEYQPWDYIHKTTYKLLTLIILVGASYLKSDIDIYGKPVLVKAHLLLE